MDRRSRLSQDENRLFEDYYVPVAYYRMQRHNTVMRDVETPYGLRFVVLHMREIYQHARNSGRKITKIGSLDESLDDGHIWAHLVDKGSEWILSVARHQRSGRGSGRHAEIC